MLLSRTVLLWRLNHRDSTLGLRLRERRCFDTSDCPCEEKGTWGGAWREDRRVQRVIKGRIRNMLRGKNILH